MADLDSVKSGGNSILEYSLAELAFILFFLLLLFIGYQVIEHQDELKDRDEQITGKDTEINKLKGTIAAIKQENLNLGETVSSLTEDINNITNALPPPEDGGNFNPNDVVEALRLAGANAATVKSQTTQNSRLKDQLKAAQDENERTTQKLINVQDENKRVTQRINAAVTRGTTTLCTYEIPAEDSDRPIGPSVPIGTVDVQATGITLLEHGFPQGKTFVDYYNEPFDSELFRRAFEIINKWNLKELYDWDQFRDLARGLNQIGDDYKNDTRKECRFHFAYYYEESLPPSLSEDFKVMVYHNSRRILREEYLRLINNGL